MAADYKSCDPAKLAAAAYPFQSALNEEERLAVELVMRAAELKAVGGTDYTGGLAGVNKASVDAKGFTGSQGFEQPDRQAIALYIDLQNAIFNGASTLPTTPSGLRALAQCWMCKDTNTKRNLLLFFKCKLNSLDQPE